MALSTLAGWTGSAIITKLVDVALSYLRERMLPADTEAELNRLKLALPKIQAVMNVSETLKFKHPNSGVVEWLNDFKLAFLAADDVLDELEYRELEKMVKKRDQVRICKKGEMAEIIDAEVNGQNRGEDEIIDAEVDCSEIHQ